MKPALSVKRKDEKALSGRALTVLLTGVLDKGVPFRFAVTGYSMYPFIKDKSIWPYEPDVMYFEDWPVRHPSLLFAGLEFNRTEFIDLWKTLDADPTKDEIIRNFPIRQPILWIN